MKRRKSESFSQQQAAAILGVTTQQMTALIRKGRVNGRVFGGYWRVSRNELQMVCMVSGLSSKWMEVI